ncbi:GTPase-activating protein MDR1 KNAG_0B01040 [Huiozyma naganishii CBS 8797]|uniref:Rab-GAP TBC domain-containing protein n=1 Tax=Huiozyma naganishii (strain ATCC MYA-139 / BCRC 22969 / CBS 8797 / KCTC 17520 / NBRC 10181 / NCYC 3082 / Yp74L-3) TaxID=1071383 RepID=J7S4G4_HUIN7|nr:hypothetical protein KNAG_0B01040 [Kazachstania naganishii CBS 8797]CCK68551.1 hypothetical protein KNAG_0B01040 [Kazachstania naganishii CBS 8797]
MSFFESLRQKATFIDKIAESFGTTLTRDERFKLEYKLPADENIMLDINADISFKCIHARDQTFKVSTNDKNSHAANIDGPPSVHYVFSGKLYLTSHFLVFRDSFDQKSCILVLNISTIKKVERTPSSLYAFSLTIHLYSNTQILIQFIGLKYKSEQFCEQLKRNLKENIPNVKRLSYFLSTCYSEFLINKNVLRQKDIRAPPAGLGQTYRYPGSPDIAKEKAKLRLWFDYFKENGQNISMVRTLYFQKLVRIGIPNRLRGEIWDVCSGSMFLREANEDLYERLLSSNKNKSSQATEEIEKDLKRSLPEYSAYQTEEGIQRLRNVLTAYSWKNPDVGYCQAMNIVCAALLIYMTEEQAFWCLCNLCDIYVPGYYSKTMYGTLLDQRVFESFVEEKLPVIWNHLEKHDIQLSIISLPWFLSLFYTSMPLEYAVRIMDIFFMNGAKSLFQVALAVLKVNADDILSSEDDGMFIAVIKTNFHSLHESAHPDSRDIKYRQITHFQTLLVTAFKEFSVIDDELIGQERNKYKKAIFQDIETFVKKTQLRHLPKVFHLTDDNLSNIYDMFYQSIETHKISMGTGSSNMQFDVFVQFMTRLCQWCTTTTKSDDDKFVPQRNAFLTKLFVKWDRSELNELTLTDTILGFDKLVTPDLLESINNFFSLYDSDDDGELQRDEVLQMAEGLLFLTEPWKSGKIIDKLTQRSIENDIAEKIIHDTGNELQDKNNIELPTDVSIDEDKYKSEQTERYLQANSNFLQRSFEYAKSLELADDFNLIDLSDDDNDMNGSIPFEIKENRKKKKFESLMANAALDPIHPKVLDLATFRMIVLADETYELFFAETFRLSINLDINFGSNNDRGKALRGMFDGIIADGRRVAEHVRRRVDSVATKNSAVSIEGSIPATITSTMTNGSRFEDLDDFTSEPQDEQEELLKNSWLDEDDADEGQGARKEQTVELLNPESEPDLIEFET